MVINQEDLTGETLQQNLPGSTSQYPNWKRKMRVGVEDLSQLDVIWLRDILARSGRIE
jgi:4-alpha-glucanotransferase/(1->4)-alpha-D-glucan 1-alpha-D-glucosylmutase